MSVNPTDPRRPDDPADTGHEWDGIREFDNPLPRWWLYVFYASILYAIVCWVLMPAWPLVTTHTTGLLNQSDRVAVVQELDALRALRGPRMAALSSASLETINQDETLRSFAEHAGQAAFGDNCATCHGAGGAGRPGYPVLADNVWIWGGTLDDIETTILYGIRSGHEQTRFSQMPAYGRDELLPRAQINDVAEHVLALSGQDHDAKAAQRGALTYAEQCSACHGSGGAGDRAQGAPSLTDQVWLYGGARDDIRKQIWNGRAGVMPNWNARLTPETIKALTVYVWSLGGGEATPKPAPSEPALPTEGAQTP